MPRPNLLRLFCCVLFTALVGVPVSAQTSGLPQFGSFSGGPDIINNENLNAYWKIPVRQKEGRGTNFGYDLVYNSLVWTQVTSGSTVSWTPAPYNTKTIPGWQGLTPAGASYISYSVVYTQGTCGQYGQGTVQEWQYNNFQYFDQYGTVYNLGLSGTVYNASPVLACPPSATYPSAPWTSSVGGYTVELTPSSNSQSISGYVKDTMGNTMYPPIVSNPTLTSYTSTDRNGNEITDNSSGVWTDTLGQTALTIVGAAPSNTNLSYAAPGATASYVVSYKTYTVQTNFGCNGVHEYGPTSMSLVDKVTLPDGSYYQFAYETAYGDNHSPHYVTGRVSSVQLPKGGAITYQYNSTGPDGPNDISCSDFGPTTLLRYTPDTGSTNYWSYNRTVNYPDAQTTITDPLGNQTVIQFKSGFETQRLIYQGASSLKQTVTSCYNGNTSNCATTAVTSPVTERNVITQFGSSGSQTSQAFYYDSNTGLLREEDDYDYSTSGPPTTILRKMIIAYAALGNGIADKPASVTICSGSGSSSSCAGPSGGSTGTVLSQTTYTYDEHTPAQSSNTPQHTSITGARGNATTIASMVNGSTTLSRTFTYYDTGMLESANDVNGATITYNYPDATSTCGNAFPTSITEPLGLSRSMTWNCNGAVQLTSVDENSHTTTYAYANDPYYWRPDSVTDPTGAVTNFCYGLLSNGTCTRNATQVETYLSLNSNSAVDTLNTADDLGRIHLQQTRQGPSSSSSSFDTVETDYDALGRVNRVTLPFNAGAGETSSTAPGTSSQYDALSRISSVTDSNNGTTTYTYTNNDTIVAVGPAPSGENLKQRQFEYDGLGRIISVCEVTSGTSSYPGGNCVQNNALVGYYTTYSYDANGNLLTVTQNAQAGSGSQQTRSYSYDGLNRITSETNPEIGPSSGPAPINYVYDSDATCGSYAGDRVKKVDPQGDTICFAYDALHRNTSITFSGPYASVTPNRYFVYDAANVDAAAMVNVKNRLAEAYTAASQGGTKITDEGLSYTARGEVSDLYQMTPQTSPNYYHVTQTYWPHGSPDTLSAAYNGSAITGLPTITYGGTIGSTVGLDGEGRITQVTASSGVQNPVTGVTYNPYGTPPQMAVTFGSGDSDVFTYDPNTERMTKYQFKVGSIGQSDSGTLTWNANSTLQKLGISDSFNSNDSQTCTYGYDDMVRLASANCGTVQAHTFTYDPFGNISKTGNPGYSFLPNYSITRNRISSVGSTNATYDSNGNVLYDTVHSYSWDADGNAVSVDSVGLTYDAFDRAVESHNAGTYTQIVYAPTTQKLALMTNKSTLKAGFVRLPGQATAVYTSAGLDHYRHSDWLGNVRLTSSPSRSVQFTTAYDPVGDTYSSSGTIDDSFTGQNPDTVSTDYDFLYREYSTEGRWSSPDPAGTAAAEPANPQSWNRYAYVLNNPVSITDALGLDTCYFEDGSPYTCDPMFDASYSGPAPTPGYIYSQQITQSNSWVTAHTGIYDPKKRTVIPGSGFVWTSCVAASGLSNSCSPGYKGGGEITQGFKYVVYEMIQGRLAQIRIDISNPNQVNARDLPGEMNAINNLVWWEAAGANSGPSVPQTSASCSSIISAVMSQWSQQLQEWIKAHPGEVPPPSIATPPNLSGTCG